MTAIERETQRLHKIALQGIRLPDLIRMSLETGEVLGLRRAGRLKTAARRGESIGDWGEGFDEGHDEHQELCRLEARRLGKKGTK